MATGDARVPEKFFGRFAYVRENGLKWQLVNDINFTKVIAKNEEPGKYNLDTVAFENKTKYHGWELGKPFEDKGLDGKRLRIVFKMENDVLTEQYLSLDDPKDKGEKHYYTIEDDDMLVQDMEKLEKKGEIYRTDKFHRVKN